MDRLEIGEQIVTMATPRHLVAMEASWELDALAGLLPGLVDAEGVPLAQQLAVRGIAGRLRTLASSLMSALGDPQDDVGRIERQMLLAPARVGQD